MASSPEKEFDVFIAHDRKDEQFKNTLVNYLKEKKITWFPEQQDSGPETTESVDINEKMKKCRKILFIISRAYLKNDSIKFEKSQAEQISQSEGRKNIIYVLYGDVKEDEIPYPFKNPTYLRYPDPEENERFFLKLKKQIEGNKTFTIINKIIKI